MGITAFYGQHMPDEDALELLRGVFGLGYAHFDTAEAYKSRKGEHHNEEILGRLLKTLPRGAFTVATKYMPSLHGGKCDLATVKAAVDASRERLGLDFIDVYYCHRMPETIDLLEEWMYSMKEIVGSGVVKHVGLSEVSPKWLRKAHSVFPVACIQQEWSIFSRNLEDSLVYTCKDLGVGIVAYSPLARSLLCDPLVPPKDWRAGAVPRFSEENFGRNKELVGRIASLASARQATSAQLALAWLYNQARVMGVPMITIPGTTQLLHAADNAAALRLTVTEAEHEELLELSALVAGARGREAYLKEAMEGQLESA